MNKKAEHGLPRQAKTKPSTKLNLATDVAMILAVLFETIWAFGVSWSAGAAGLAPYRREGARVRAATPA